MQIVKPATSEPSEEHFINRELSWLEFNARVLEEAGDMSNPVLERLKFAVIVSSNLDEFFMVRVAKLKNAVRQGDTAPDLSGQTPSQQLTQISLRAHEHVDQLYETLSERVLASLAERGIRVQQIEDLESEQRFWLHQRFREEVLPALTPLAIDASRPFPMLANLSLNVAVMLAASEEGGSPRLGVVQVPAGLHRLMQPPGKNHDYVLLDQLIRSELPALFPGQEILDAAVFRISRDSELELDDEGGEEDWLEAVQVELRKRRRSQVVRLEVEAGVGRELLALLTSRLDLREPDIYFIPGPLDIRVLRRLQDDETVEDLREGPLRPVPAIDAREAEDLFGLLDERDVLLHHPYDAFDPVAALVTRAAEDPNVLAIKQTLYRTSGADSPLVRALGRAAESGKQVTVLVELMARFDEQSNIRWARSLEESGAHVIYGVRGYKTHAKVCLVVCRSSRGIRRYVHLGTGNYNERTATQYTDFGLLTSDFTIGEDVSRFFNALTGYSDAPRLRKLVMAPTGMRERIVKLIERETRHAEEGQAAHIRAKMNSLTDGEIIRALYTASRAGVRIDLNIRGICCLRPGIPGLSETIRVVSIVDRFLEHARIFHFRNSGADEVFLASADWMPRNLNRRIELLFPVESQSGRVKLFAALDALFRDDVKARHLGADGRYTRGVVEPGAEPFRAQQHLHADASRAFERARAAAGTSFEPLSSPGSE